MNNLIVEYINYNYALSSNIDGWCILEKSKNRNIYLTRLISDIEKIFPDMGGKNICNIWWETNIEISPIKIYLKLS